jgi:hypothetical protein
MYVEEQEQIPWETLNVMVAEITYGVSTSLASFLPALLTGSVVPHAPV